MGPLLLIYLRSMPIRRLHLRLLERQLFFLLLVLQFLESGSISHHFLRVLVLAFFHFTSLPLSHSFDLPFELIFHFLFLCESMIVNPSGLQLRIRMLFIQSLQSLFLLFSRHFLITPNLTRILRLIQLILQSIYHSLILIHLSFLCQDLFRIISETIKLNHSLT